ncbi:hypothetical protein PFICI_06745 [Pestalotiopsis fici W106-1]|uniref:BZIP domain-containing protein n=1 Tax=Pestalotiopsis fici (strain W106-1 / CGMCC3.15140) TaxID=1229662 RepID=W3X6L8_PESFW|nr:uncharacterized protein PFICI_06745 [Pestalotiopsis fici W106-1]ETS81743.1 hypothetical protein PFICI_06745 [Pestalotiopsis fici W106-1]
MPPQTEPATSRGTTHTAVSLRKARKREADRKSQQAARERTKNRIAFLEALVLDLEQQDPTSNAQELIRQHDEVRAERDSLAQALSAIERIIKDRKGHRPAPGSANAPPCDNQSSPPPDDGQRSDNSGFGDTGYLSPLATVSNFNSECGENNVHVPSKTSALGLDQTLVPESEFMFDDVLPMDEVLTCIPPDPIIPPAAMSKCDCAPRSSPKATMEGGANLWRYANEVLSEPTPWCPQLSAQEAMVEDDTPVRAIIDGWDAVERRAGGRLLPSWQKLRQIDEAIFSSCAKVERLAILRLMHILLRFHQEGSEQKREAVPLWYLARPSQSIAHSYAIDFFAWPGLRERFVFQQHRYCSNMFWQLFCSSLHILWPFEFRDCYFRNTDTNEYKVSPAFDERIKDINVWTMSGDIFKMWPEFLSDMPRFNRGPGRELTSNLSNINRMLNSEMRGSAEDGSDETGEVSLDIGYQTQWVNQHGSGQQTNLGLDANLDQ